MGRNVRRIVRVSALVAAVLSLSGCDYRVGELDVWGFNPGHGDTVTVVMVPGVIDGTGRETAQRCADMGGVYSWDSVALAEVCVGVDF